MTTLTQGYTVSRSIVMVFIGSMVLAISAHLSIPLLPVPVTFQTMALLLLAIFLGPQLACGAALAYLAEGAAGLPVFATLTGSMTVGYLLALPAAAYIAGYIAQKRTFSRIVIAGVIEALVVLTIGTLFLGYFLGLKLAFAFGFKPFILIEIIKALAVAGGVTLSNRLRPKSN